MPLAQTMPTRRAKCGIGFSKVMAFSPISTRPEKRKTTRGCRRYFTRHHSSVPVREHLVPEYWEALVFRTCRIGFMAHRAAIPKDRGASRRRFFVQKALIEK